MSDLEHVQDSLEDSPLLTESERIARRLHDGLMQSLSAVGMRLRAARGMVDDPEAVFLHMGAATDEIDRIIRQLRSYIFVLKPGLISGFELEHELRSLARQLEAGKNVSMAVEIDSLAASTLAARSRSEDVVQTVKEAIANTLRYSTGKKVGLALFLVNGAAMLEVRGEGGELDPEQLIGGGHDFSNLRASARALSAVLEVESHRGEGTRVRVRIPVAEEADGARATNGGRRGIPVAEEADGARAASGGRRGIRVVIVDEHEIVREGVRALIGLDGDIVVCGEAGSVSEALRVAEWTRPDVVVMDVHLAGGGAIEATRALRAHHPATRVLALASFGDDEALFSSIMAGAAGFVLKEIKGHRLVEAIRSVAAGQDLLDPAVTRSVFERLRQTARPASDEKLSRLSPQEERILSLVAQGKSNRQIAQVLHLAEKTIKNYVSSILAKLEVTRRVQAAAYFTRRL